MPARPDVRISDDPIGASARSIARRLQIAVGRRGGATLAVSGGSTAQPMFEVLAGLDVPWRHVGVWQVDERVAPDGHPDRNANALDTLPGRHRLMPVTADDLVAACRRYARTLPERFDVVHLGIGDDGHTASWPPGDPVIDRRDPVALSDIYEGRVRMTLTPPVVNAARSRVILAFGAGKAAVLADWDGPVSRVKRTATVLFTDFAAAGGFAERHA